jgi:glutaredoxin-related protein
METGCWNSEIFDAGTEKRENALDSVLQYRDSAKEFDYNRAFGRIERQEIIATCKTA